MSLPSNYIEDFTVAHYRELLKLAKENYRFIGYGDIEFGSRFVLWRHDCDFSLNRSLRLAGIEREYDIRATYFLNPHSEFYNPLEADQARIVETIISLGHDIGLHFDAAYYEVRSENDLDELVAREAGWLYDWFGVKPVAFSFHNPSTLLLSCEQDQYGGLINCYSRTFKQKICYCSDSNGYWRFQRLHDALRDPGNEYLQVLTHDAWWQEKPLEPRERVFRSVYGRAIATMDFYDDLLHTHGRENIAGPSGNLRIFQRSDPSTFRTCDYLWNMRQYDCLFTELWRLHERQLYAMCRTLLVNVWNAPAHEVDMVLRTGRITTKDGDLFSVVFGKPCAVLAGVSEDDYRRWSTIRENVAHVGEVATELLVEGCVFICRVMAALGEWGSSSEIHYDGIRRLPDGAGNTTVKRETSLVRVENNDSDREIVDKWASLVQSIQSRPGA